MNFTVSECIQGKQFVYNNEALNFDEARVICQTLESGGDLAVTDNEEKYNFAVDFGLSVNSVDEIWVGLVREANVPDFTDPIFYEYVDGTPIVEGAFASEKGVFPWDEAAPNDENNDQRHGARIQGSLRTLEDRGVSSRFNSLCEQQCLKPSPSPTLAPEVITAFPTPSPTTSPTKFPSESPTISPTISPTDSPTIFQDSNELKETIFLSGILIFGLAFLISIFPLVIKLRIYFKTS